MRATTQKKMCAKCTFADDTYTQNHGHRGAYGTNKFFTASASPKEIITAHHNCKIRHSLNAIIFFPST